MTRQVRVDVDILMRLAKLARHLECSQGEAVAVMVKHFANRVGGDDELAHIYADQVVEESTRQAERLRAGERRDSLAVRYREAR